MIQMSEPLARSDRQVNDRQRSGQRPCATRDDANAGDGADQSPRVIERELWQQLQGRGVTHGQRGKWA